MRIPGVDALEFLAEMRRNNPEIERAEAAMGSRLVVARNVLNLRVGSGITQTELARRAGISHSQIARIEAAEANTTVNMLDRIAKAFGVETAALLERRAEAGSTSWPHADRKRKTALPRRRAVLFSRRSPRRRTS